LLVLQNDRDVRPIRRQPARNAQHEVAVPRTQIHDRTWPLAVTVLHQRGCNNVGVHHQRVGAPDIAPRPDGTRVIRRQLIEQFGFDAARKAH